MDKTTGRLNLAYQALTAMPEKYVEKDKGKEIKEIDLTSNRIMYPLFEQGSLSETHLFFLHDQ